MKRTKYSDHFNRDYDFYFKNRNIFNFSGRMDCEYVDKKGNKLIVFSENGVSAKQAFYVFDSQGKIAETCEPKILLELYRCKGSINFHITQWAEGRADLTMPRIEWDVYIEKMGLLPWICDAVEKQRFKIIEEKGGIDFIFRGCI